jgi:hypothetical protein
MNNISLFYSIIPLQYEKKAIEDETVVVKIFCSSATSQHLFDNLLDHVIEMMCAKNEKDKIKNFSNS